jgi:hypothetical protein
MAFIPAPGVAQVEIRASYFGIFVENVFNFTTGEDPATESVLVDLAAQVASSWTANLMPELNISYTLREIFAFDLSVQSGAQATDTTVLGQAGGVNQAGMPGNVAFCVSKRTGLRGRSFRGRTYFVGLSEPDVASNILDATRAGNLVDGLEAFRSDLISAGFQMVIVSRASNGAPRVTAVSTPVVAVLAVDNRVDTQRRRLE